MIRKSRPCLAASVDRPHIPAVGLSKQQVSPSVRVKRPEIASYIEPPKFRVANLIAEGNFLTALGDIIMKDKDGQETHYSYCDVWRFGDGKMVELKAFVIRTETE